MSIVDFILQDKTVLLTIVAAGAVILLAVILFTVAQIRALLFRMRAMQDEAIDILNGVDTGDEADADALPIAVPVVAHAPAPAPPTPAAAASTPEETPEAASDMQKLIESVFTDEEVASRRASLVEASKPVDMQALAALTQEVSERLRAAAEAAT
ncbi:MAG: hypothetical protein U0670_05445 [Anaerolineae bacterium]